MTTLYVTHAACLNHDTGEWHPERADRLRAIEHALSTKTFQHLHRDEAPLATMEQIGRVHPESYIASINAKRPAHGRIAIDGGDTVMSPGSWDAVMRACGAGIYAVDEVMSGRATNAFCAVRPPGHHAEPARAMGFCIFNGIAAAALHARAVHGAERIAVVDFDVHHGNGTQAVFWFDPDLLYASTHQMPLFPGSGASNERGDHGNIVNAPLRSGADSAAFRSAVESVILPAVERHKPDLLLVSAGFDAHYADPLASLELTEEDFAWVTTKLIDSAARHCNGRLVSILEGGYDLGALGRSAAAHVQALMEYY